MALDDDEEELEVAGGTTGEQARAHKEAKSRTQARLQLRSMGGPQKAAVILMAVGEQRAGTLFAKMDDEEIKSLAIDIAVSAMPQLSHVATNVDPERTATIYQEVSDEEVDRFSMEIEK